MSVRYALVREGFINKNGAVERQDKVVKTQSAPFKKIPEFHFVYQEQKNSLDEWEEIEGSRIFN